MQALEELENALEHLERALKEIEDIPQTKRVGRARSETLHAAGYTIGALWQLRQEKEE